MKDTGQKKAKRAPKGKTAGGPAAEGARFKAVRQAHSLELAEDYVETISDLIESKGEARTTDIARLLGVSHSTVNINLGRLKSKGFVLTEKYQAVRLTSTGEKLALATKRRHDVVTKFLSALDLPSQIVETDAEGLEHHLSPQTVAALESLTARLLKSK